MSYEEFIKSAKKNPELLKMKVNEIRSKFNLTDAEFEQVTHMVNTCKGLSGQELAARISADRHGGGGGTVP
jgi:hypothetical protein